ncbi:LacI family DNA-binding transcriptional regulator [Planococcus donghaensis]|uniref:LacI family DNA-binding transcriptional regulator n=1 Tax=Planococcus donghaensis TaxID=414778 RepID=UPI001EE1CF4A|nr:LacI family DNA-binding transcriptional regulator [Planococcus donghaensis]
MSNPNESLNQKVKLDDVATEAGVSKTTVSRVLNNRGYISEKTRKKVHEAVELLNYHPNEIARSLFINKTFIIGLIFPTTSNPFYGQLIFHLENTCESLGYKVLLCNSQGREDKEKSYLEMLQRHQVDGIIAGSHNRGILEYDNPNLPLVGIDRYLSKNTPVVSGDNYDGGKKATQLLIDKGCKKIIHINGSPSLETPANLRREAYEDTMRENQYLPQSYIMGGNVIETIFDENLNMDGIFASDDLIASSVIKEAKKRNINIPGDLKVVGYDGSEVTRMLLPELTTIQQPVKEIAELAVELLLKQINGERESEMEWKLPVKLIESETT